MISVLDFTGNLSPADREQLARHVITDCYSTPLDRKWLAHIAVREDVGAPYNGTWKARIRADPVTKVVFDIEAVIVLNRYYLPSMSEMCEVLTHEYGHHVTLSYLLMSHNISNDMSGLIKERLPIDYYRARNIERLYDAICPDYSGPNGWDDCDKEILAEDYRVLFTRSPAPHKMAASHGLPDAMVRDWIWHLFHPHHVGSAWPFWP